MDALRARPELMGARAAWLRGKIWGGGERGWGLSIAGASPNFGGQPVGGERELPSSQHHTS